MNKLTTGTPFSTMWFQSREEKNRLAYLLEKLKTTLKEISEEFPDVELQVTKQSNCNK